VTVDKSFIDELHGGNWRYLIRNRERLSSLIVPAIRFVADSIRNMARDDLIGQFLSTANANATDYCV
jgi:hypothetical protein